MVTVVALVLGGLGAVVLAVAVAGKEAQRAKAATHVTSAQVAPSRAPVGSAAPSRSEIEIPAEVLYPVESDTPADP
ncbi:MAG: hypothetical protein K0R38_355 [Polyangiaceae bacterium]|nr:hypothetical protein [Polyangiaceae bacterium]